MTLKKKKKTSLKVFESNIIYWKMVFDDVYEGLHRSVVVSISSRVYVESVRTERKFDWTHSQNSI